MVDNRIDRSSTLSGHGRRGLWTARRVSTPGSRRSAILNRSNTSSMIDSTEPNSTGGYEATDPVAPTPFAGVLGFCRRRGISMNASPTAGIIVYAIVPTRRRSHNRIVRPDCGIRIPARGRRVSVTGRTHPPTHHINEPERAIPNCRHIGPWITIHDKIMVFLVFQYPRRSPDRLYIYIIVINISKIGSKMEMRKMGLEFSP